MSFKGQYRKMPRREPCVEVEEAISFKEKKEKEEEEEELRSCNKKIISAK